MTITNEFAQRLLQVVETTPDEQIVERLKKMGITQNDFSNFVKAYGLETDPGARQILESFITPYQKMEVVRIVRAEQAGFNIYRSLISFLDRIARATGYRAIWPPSQVLNVGHILEIDKRGISTIQSTLEQEGIQLKIRTESVPDVLVEDGVQAMSRVTGTGKVLRFDFPDQGGIFLRASRCTKSSLDNLLEVESILIEKYSSGSWKSTWVVVSDVIQPENLTVIVGGRKSAIEFSWPVQSEYTQGLPILPANLRVISQSGQIQHYTGLANATPLYQVIGVQQPGGELDEEPDQLTDASVEIRRLDPEADIRIENN